MIAQRRALQFVLSFAISASAVGSASAELLFDDSFSTRDLSKHNENFRWGRSGNIPEADGTSSRVTLAKQPNGQLGPVLKFSYGTWQELRFHLTSSLSENRTESGSSNVAYPEIWMRYQIRVPENYFHALNDKGEPAGQNNKGWVTLWKHNYKDALVMTRFEWWPVDVSNELAGGSAASGIHKSGGGHDMNPGFVSSDRQIPGSYKAWAIKPSDRGEWIDYVFHFKVASGPKASDGLMEVYKDGELAIGWYNKPIRPTDGNPEHAGFDRGYIMGYHNSGYAEQTTFYIDNFKIGTTAESVGLSDPYSRAPNPPKVFTPKG
jgi:hypothetical protein